MMILSQTAVRQDESTEVSILREVQWCKVNRDCTVTLHSTKEYVNPLILYLNARWWGVAGVTPHALTQRNSSHCSLNRSFIEPYSWLVTWRRPLLLLGIDHDPWVVQSITYSLNRLRYPGCKNIMDWMNWEMKIQALENVI